MYRSPSRRRRTLRARPRLAELWRPVVFSALFWGGLFGLLLAASPTRVSAQAPGATDPGPRGADPDDYRQAAQANEALTGQAYTPPPVAALPKLDDDDGRGRRVVVIPVHGTIELGLSPFIQRALDESGDVAVVILDVDTFGGRVDAAVKIRDALLAYPKPVVAYVNRRAISAGALISFAADHIVFSAGGSMGAATPIQSGGGGEAQAVGEKMVSYMRAEMRATAEAKGRDGKLAEAMVDADVEVPGVIAKGKLLTVTTDEAIRLGIANARHDDLKSLIAALGLSEAEVVRPTENWAERLARFLTDPMVAGLLMSIGMLGLLLEFYTPGFGFAGGIGLVCLLLFFSGHMVVDIAGWEELALFVVGLAALAVEVFVIPGFGIVGAIGVGLILFSLALTIMGMPLGDAWDVGTFGSAMSTVLLALTGAGVGFLLLMRFLPSGSIGRWLVLDTALRSPRPAPRNADADGETDDAEEEWTSAPSQWRKLLGKRGVTVTELRPSGKARIEGRVYDVVADGEWIERNIPVEVVEVEGVRVVVASAPDPVSAPVTPTPTSTRPAEDPPLTPESVPPSGDKEN